MAQRTTVSFEIRRLCENNLKGILYDEHGQKTGETNVGVCADQIAYMATKGGERPLAYLGMVVMSKGDWIPVKTDMRCDVRRHDWVWEKHHHTHGSLKRCPVQEKEKV